MASSLTFDRRQLLKAGAVAGIMLPGLSTIGQEQQEKQRFKKAVKFGMVKTDGDLVEKFKLLKELGFDGIELDSPGGPTPDQVQKAIKESGLPVHGVVDSVHWNQTLSHADESVRAAGLEGLKTALQASKDYGGTSVLLVPGVVNDDVTYEQCWQRSIEEIKKAIPLAEKLEIDILLENVWNKFLTDPKETARFIDELDCDRIGAYYDVGNSVTYAPPVKWIETLGHRIKKLDIKEYDLKKEKADGGNAGFNVKLLEGSCDWPNTIAVLEKLNYEGWATAEIPGGDRERLKEIAERMDKIFAS